MILNHFITINITKKINAIKQIKSYFFELCLVKQNKKCKGILLFNLVNIS